jgi:DNA-binding transcriptional MerR regulator
MQAERIRVLELVKNGTLTIEQGDELIDALQAANQPNFQASNQPDFAGPVPPRPPVAPKPPKPPRAPRASGGGKFSFDKMIQLSNHGIDLGFVRELSEAGLGKFSFEDLIAFGNHGVEADFIIGLRELAQEFDFEELDARQIIAFSNHGIEVSYVREMFEAGLENVDFDDMIAFGNHGIEASYVRELGELAGEFEIDGFDAQKIIELGIHGVEVAEVREMLESGLFDISSAPSVKGSAKRVAREAQREARRASREARHVSGANAFAQERKHLEAQIEAINARLQQVENPQERQDLVGELTELHAALEGLQTTVTVKTKTTTIEEEGE